MASKDIKTKNKSPKGKNPVKSTVKEKGSISPMNDVKAVVHDQFVKEWTEHQQSSQQSERAENYAVDKVEDTASAAADTVYHGVKGAVSHTVRNLPKTKDAEAAPTDKEPKTGGQSNTPRNAPKTAQQAETTTDTPIKGPKTKEAYTLSGGSTPVPRNTSSAPVQANNPAPIKGPKTKEAVMSVEGKTPVTPSMPETPANGSTPVHNAPKTKEAPKTAGQAKTPDVIKGPKTKEAVISAEEKKPATPSTPETPTNGSAPVHNAPKTKEEYLKSKGTTPVSEAKPAAEDLSAVQPRGSEQPYTVKPSVNGEKKPDIKTKESTAPLVKTKEVYMQQNTGNELQHQPQAQTVEHGSQQTPIDAARRRFIQNKMKSKAEIEAELPETDVFPTEPIHADVYGTPIQPDSVKKDVQPDIKTKEAYLARTGEVPKTDAVDRSRQEYAKRETGIKRRNSAEVQPPADGQLPHTGTEPKTALSSTSPQGADPHTETPISASEQKYKYKTSAFFSPEEPRQPIEAVPADTGKPAYIKTKENYMQAQRAERVKSKDKSSITLPKQKSPISDVPKMKATNKSKPPEKGKRRLFKSVLTPKSRAKGAKTAARNAEKKVAKKAAKEAAKRSAQVARKSYQAAKATAKAAVKITAKVIQLAVHAVKALFSALAALGGWAVLVVVLIAIVIVAAMAASPFGIFISDEAAEAGSIPVSSIVNECNMELSAWLTNIEDTTAHDRIVMEGEQADWNLILALFSVKVAGTGDDTAQDVVVIDDVKKQKLIEVFWDMNIITYRTETVTSGETSETTLYITITAKTKDEMISLYHFNDKQKEALETLLENADGFMGARQSLAISDATAQEVIKNLPDTLAEERKTVVKKACSLVGKVTYFWGGKSSAIGWDPEWGKMKLVTAEGSRSTGCMRPFGLDCSGFVTWSFINAGYSASAIGHGTSGQIARGTRISWSSAQPGDLAFYTDKSHVGIIACRDASGNILVVHCASGANNVVITTGGFGFAVRPNCY